MAMVFLKFQFKIIILTVFYKLLLFQWICITWLGVNKDMAKRKEPGKQDNKVCYYWTRVLTRAGIQAWPAQHKLWLLSYGEAALVSIYCLKVRASNLMLPFYLYRVVVWQTFPNPSAVVCIYWNGIFPVGIQLRVGQQTLWPKQMFLGFKALSTLSSVFSISLQT